MNKVIEGEYTEEKWDKRKMLLGFVGIFALFFAALYIKDAYFPPSKSSQVEGVSVTSEEQVPERRYKSNIKIPTASDLEQKVNEITDQASSIDVAEVASSSPQVQKVIKDLQSLGNYPRSQAKQMCEQVCSGL